MSHQTQIDYQQIATQCNATCELTEKQLAEMDEMLAQLERTSSSLLSEQTKALSENIKVERDRLLQKLQEMRKAADGYAAQGRGLDERVYIKALKAITGKLLKKATAL